MNYYDAIDKCNTLKAQYNGLHIATPSLSPELKAKLSLSLQFLNPAHRTELNLASIYSLEGRGALISTVMKDDHPMRDLFTSKGDPVDVQAVRYVRNYLEKHRIQQEISRLEALTI